jgi:hypothetical protein
MSLALPKRSPHVHRNFPVPVSDIHDAGFIRLFLLHVFLIHAPGISIFHRDGQEGSAADEYPCA